MSTWLRAARGRATRRGIDFAIGLDELVELWENQGGKCYYTGVEMTYAEGDRTAVSLDRIDPSKGYVSENVVLCCWIVNLMKLDLSVEGFKQWCQKVVENE